MSSFGIIKPEPDMKCELCGKIAETRPYGPKSERVCFDCGMKDVEACEKGFEKLVLGIKRK